MRQLRMNEAVALLPTGVVGVALTAVFLGGIVVAPGSFYTVVPGGVVGLAGVVLSILGIAQRSGRIHGAIGTCLFILAWAINSFATSLR